MNRINTHASQATDAQPANVRPEDSMDVAELRLEVAKWRVIAFWGLPDDTHDIVTGNTAQEIEDKAHSLAAMLHLIPTK
ncbi:hypothetical protein CVS30_03805 [Arthrobacter psychrolactophilus]|uniref:Uncharacterized protein n=1 Tax=Arthrobacter psychrolactophilus TaxID=92442 RepID=A0A2V5IZB9_9MICC|nr:hypothetical protein [Arthrobacter psychrolactophilus]PYI39794.1 hypothetical protein CVS30_03805 [Arthrobacter psychrolactophilus]